MNRLYIYIICFMFFCFNIWNINLKYVINDCIDYQFYKKTTIDTIRLIGKYSESKNDYLQSDSIVKQLFEIKTLTLNANNIEIKQKAIKNFIQKTNSSDSRISNLAAKCLKSYQKNYFDKTDIDSIGKILSKCPYAYKELVELAGYVGNNSFIKLIKEIYPNSRHFSRQEIWSTKKALARLGDIDALNYCINKVKSLKINDQVVDNVYPDLIYIHRKEAFNIIIQALNSDERLCTSLNPNADSQIPCGYRIMEMLAPELVDFPIKVLPSGDLDTKNYSKSLLAVRKWFAKKNDSYVIVDKY